MMDKSKCQPGSVVLAAELYSRDIIEPHWCMVVDPLYWREKLILDGYPYDEQKRLAQVAADSGLVTLRTFYPVKINEAETGDRYMPLRLVFYVYARVADIRISYTLPEWVEGGGCSLFMMTTKEQLDLSCYLELNEVLSLYARQGIHFGHKLGLRQNTRDLWWEVIPGIDPGCIERRKRDEEFRQIVLERSFVTRPISFRCS